jgi:nucleotide-binding universal stress UspA family protein
MQGPIVVGTDGSATATKAVLEAAQLAKVFDQPLHIVHAYKAQPLRVDAGPEAMPSPVSSLSIADSVLADVGSRARQSGAVVELHAIDGDAAGAILDIAASVGADLIVVGNRGIGSMRRFLLGNVPSKVVHNSPCSTYVVHTT